MMDVVQSAQECTAPIDENGTIALRHTSGEALEMPRLGFGGGIFSNDAEAAFASAIEVGYRLFDVAPKYGGAEAALGRAIKRGNVPRNSLFLVSKVGNAGSEATKRSVEASLKALGTTYLDLLLMHSAVYQPAARDPSSALHGLKRLETWRTLQQLRASGRVRALGVCNTSPRQMAKLKPLPSVVQIEHHPLLQRNETLDFCRQHSIAVQVYGSGGGGWKLWQKDPSLDLLGRPPLQAAASAHGKSAHQISLRWALEQGVCVIPKAAQADHQRANRDVFDFELGHFERAAINGLHAGKSLYGFRDADEYT